MWHPSENYKILYLNTTGIKTLDTCAWGHMLTKIKNIEQDELGDNGYRYVDVGSLLLKRNILFYFYIL